MMEKFVIQLREQGEDWQHALGMLPDPWTLSLPYDPGGGICWKPFTHRAFTYATIELAMKDIDRAQTATYHKTIELGVGCYYVVVIDLETGALLGGVQYDYSMDESGNHLHHRTVHPMPDEGIYELS